MKDMRKKATHFKSWRQIQIFPACGPIEILAVEILRLLPRTIKENRYVAEMIDW